MWETHRQPRLHLSRRPLSQRIDRSTARAVEMWLSEGAHGVSSALLDVPDASVTEMMMMCNPVTDHGPAEWHPRHVPADLGAAPQLQRGHSGERAALRAVEHLPVRGRRAVGGARQPRAAQHRGGERATPRQPARAAAQRRADPSAAGGRGGLHPADPALGQRLSGEAAALHPRRASRATLRTATSRSFRTCRLPHGRRSSAGRNAPTGRSSTPRQPSAPRWPATPGRTVRRSTGSTRDAARRARCSSPST